MQNIGLIVLVFAAAIDNLEKKEYGQDYFCRIAMASGVFALAASCVGMQAGLIVYCGVTPANIQRRASIAYWVSLVVRGQIVPIHI